MSSQNRPSTMDPSGEWPAAQEILRSTDVYPTHQNETTQRELNVGQEGKVLSGSYPGSSSDHPHEDLPLQSQQTPPVPVRHGDADPQPGVAESPQLPSSVSAAHALGGAWEIHKPLTGQQHSQSCILPDRYFTATPTQMTAKSSSVRSRSPLSSEPPSQNRLYGSSPQSYPRNTPQLSQQQSYSRPYTPRTNVNSRAKPFFIHGANQVRTPSSKKSSGFVAVDPFRMPSKRTRSDGTDIIPPSFDNIAVEKIQRQGTWHASQPNNYASSHPLYPPSQQHSTQQRQQSNSAPLNAHGQPKHSFGADQRHPSSSSYVRQHEGFGTHPVTPSQEFEPPAPHPPVTTSDHPVNDTQPYSRLQRLETTESSGLHCPSPGQNTCHNGMISTSAPSWWKRMANYLLWPFRHGGKLQGKLAVPSDTEELHSATRMVDSVFETIPRQVYLHILLRLPSLYFSRVARIFEEADLSLGELKEMALETGGEGKSVLFAAQVALEIAAIPPAYQRLKVTWEGFIDSVMREWKTFNIISVLLLSAILSILQIESAADDPVTRYAALTSLICALISLLFGCMYIIRFGSMRKTYKAAEWALEAQRSTTVIWWNVWVLLAMPAIWLTWSLVLYIVCIMSFVWRTSPQQDSTPPELSGEKELSMRIIITIVLGVGLAYGCLIVSTFRRYGEVMDKAWKARIKNWFDTKPAADEVYEHQGYDNPSQAYLNQPYISDHEMFCRASEHSSHTGPYDISERPPSSRSSTDSGEKRSILVVPPSPDQPPPPEPSMIMVLDSNTSNSFGLMPGDNSRLGHVHFLSPRASAQDFLTDTAGQPEETQAPSLDNKPPLTRKKGSRPGS